MTVYLLALYSESLTYTIARALVASGHAVVVCVADAERDRQSRWSLSGRIAGIAGASVRHSIESDLPSTIDWLIVQGHPQMLRHREALDPLAARALGITAISCGDRSRPFGNALRLQWRERQWYGRWYSKVRRIAYKDGPHTLDWFGLTRPRRMVGFDAHSMFLQDPTLFAAIHAQDWAAERRRPIRVNFVGSRDPDARGRILDAVEPVFERGGVNPPSKTLLWHAFSDAQPAALAPLEFVKVLSESDFTLAPRGYSLVTHRPVEALLRGSIPVLSRDELDLYDLGLVDGVNCIGVAPDGWPAAMERLLGMSEAVIARMRADIQAMLPTKVAYAALARAICDRLGVDPVPEPGHA